MEIALKDIEAQFDIFYDISLSIATTKQFQPVSFERNKFYETELLQRLEQYKNRSVLTDNYFVVYNNSESVFMSSASLHYFELFCKYTLLIEDPSALWDMLFDDGENKVIALEDKNYVIVTYKIHTMGKTRREGDAVVCFIVDKRSISDRLDYAAGGVHGKFELRYDGILMSDDTVASENAAFTKATADGLFTLVLDNPDFQPLSSFLSPINITLFSLFIVLLICLACFAAFHQYTPIKKIASKYAGSSRPDISGDELANIDNLLSEFIQKNELAQQHQIEQISLIKEQMIRLLLNGNYSHVMRERLKLFGLLLEGPYYCVYSIKLLNISFELHEGKILHLIEDLSDEDIHFYPLKESELTLTIVCELVEQYLAEEALDLITSLLDAENMDFFISDALICDDLLQLPAAYLAAVSSSSSKQAQATSRKESDEAAEPVGALIEPSLSDPFLYNSALIKQAMMRLQEGDISAAQSCLNSFIEAMSALPVSLLMQRYIFCDILTYLVKSGRSIDCVATKQQVSMLLTASDPPAFGHAVNAVLVSWHEQMQQRLRADDEKTGYKIINYIKEHCLEYDLSLDSIAHVLGLSPIAVSRVTKQVTGRSYKDYLIGLRIDHAKRMLVDENASVAEVCRRVGYANISHFIKTFKAVVGTTPAKYKKEPMP
ncbi:MAG: helix-turn-helix transcriptional regulator [Christensenellales bacterium]|jgi:YesN/AraC family two-component response regulator